MEGPGTPWASKEQVLRPKPWPCSLWWRASVFWVQNELLKLFFRTEFLILMSKIQAVWSQCGSSSLYRKLHLNNRPISTFGSYFTNSTKPRSFHAKSNSAVNYVITNFCGFYFIRRYSWSEGFPKFSISYCDYIPRYKLMKQGNFYHTVDHIFINM
jgi:hypothetical protein